MYGNEIKFSGDGIVGICTIKKASLLFNFSDYIDKFVFQVPVPEPSMVA